MRRSSAEAAAVAAAARLDCPHRRLAFALLRRLRHRHRRTSSLDGPRQVRRRCTVSCRREKAQPARWWPRSAAGQVATACVAAGQCVAAFSRLSSHNRFTVEAAACCGAAAGCAAEPPPPPLALAFCVAPPPPPRAQLGFPSAGQTPAQCFLPPIAHLASAGPAVHGCPGGRRPWPQLAFALPRSVFKGPGNLAA